MSYKKNDCIIKMLEFDKIKIGDESNLIHTITQEDVDTFASLTGDYNPLHLDPEFAKNTSFQKPVVYGMLSANFISTMIGMLLPGGGALWTSQTLQFLSPAFIGDTIKVFAKVLQKSEATRTLVLKTVIKNQHGEELITGESIVKVLELKKKREEEMNKNTKMTVLVTGGNGGIGAATAIKLAEDGHSVVINYVASPEDAQKVVDKIKAGGGKAMAFKADITNLDEVSNMFSEAEKLFGPILGVVHCAAPSNVPQPFDNLEWDDFQKQIDIHLKGAFNCAKVALPKMKEVKEGNFVFMGTIYTDGTPPPQQSRYITAKAALTSFARCLAVEYGPMGIRANVMAPGMTQTNMIADLPDKVKMLTKMQAPLRRLAEPEDVANGISFLLGSTAKYITGESLRVCGGLMMQ